MRDLTYDLGGDDEFIPDHEARGLPDPDDLPGPDANLEDYDTPEQRRLRAEAQEKAQERARKRDLEWERRRQVIREHDKEMATQVTPNRLYSVLDELDRADSEWLRQHAKEWRGLVGRTVLGTPVERNDARKELRRKPLRVRADTTWSDRDKRLFRLFHSRVTRYPK